MSAINKPVSAPNASPKPSPENLSRVTSSTTLVPTHDLKKIGTQSTYQASMQIFGAIQGIPIKIDKTNGPSAIKSFGHLESNQNWIEIRHSTWDPPFFAEETTLFDRLSENENSDGHILHFKRIGKDGLLTPCSGSTPTIGRAGGTPNCLELQEITFLSTESVRLSESKKAMDFLSEKLGETSQAITGIILEYIPFLTPRTIPQKLSHRLPAQLILPRKDDCCSLL